MASGSDDQIVMIWDLDPYVYFTPPTCSKRDASLDRMAKGKVWGSDEINVEGWKPLKRLPGHESGEPTFISLCSDPLSASLDVTDVAWSPGDRYLASVGLDSQVMVWCGFTLGRLTFDCTSELGSDLYGLERLRRLDQHQGFVKGVCWDPVGEFLATCSDDRTVKIWRTTDWSMEAEVKKPFEDSPGSTFFRRLR